MSDSIRRRMTPPRLGNVSVQGGFWGDRLDANRTVTLPREYEQLKKTGRIDAWRLDWRPGMTPQPHRFWDSDVAKWLEAAAYSLATHPDAEVEALVDGVVDLMAAAQQDDGYLNVFYTIVEPHNRWANLRDWHELYCAGHLMEAAVAHHAATGKRKFLDVMCRYADYIVSVFGPARGRKRGYPGHQEIELALVKLHHATGRSRYLDTAAFFIDERGRAPHYYDVEAEARGEQPAPPGGRSYDYCQAHLPVREQTTAEGHSVRAMYLYSGMADVAAATGDRALLEACRRLWRNVTQRRMYVTGGVGSTRHGERFTFDYDLPNESAYAETCAAIGLVFWAHRMLQIEADSSYADVMERALYNGVLSGVSLDGSLFFYENPLAVHPAANRFHPWNRGSGEVARQEWFGCACCPPNIARLLASLGRYVYSQNDSEAYVHLYVQGRAQLDLGARRVAVEQRTRYPWDGAVRIEVDCEAPATFVLALRAPGWRRGMEVAVNGQPVDVAARLSAGYVKIEREWRAGDAVELRFPMPVERIEAHPSVRMNCGRIALQRGPIVYCLEQVDNGPDLNDLVLRADADLEAIYDKTLLGGVCALSGPAARRAPGDGAEALYRPAAASNTEDVTIRAVPYYAWANRAPGEMLVWMREA